MARYIYRGTSLSAAAEQELGEGYIEGFEYDVYTGILDKNDVDSTEPRGTLVEDLPWADPEGNPGEPLRQTQGVTGGMSNRLGTAIGFSGGVPIVLYLAEGRLNGQTVQVRYNYGWFETYEGALPWVEGSPVTGEIRDQEAGLVGIFTDNDGERRVWKWGTDELQQSVWAYDDEREYLVFTDRVDISPALTGVVVWLEGGRTVTQALSALSGYHGGFGGFDAGDATDVSSWSDEKKYRTLHEEVQKRSNHRIGNLYTVLHGQHVMNSVSTIPSDGFVEAYDGDRIIEDQSELPRWVFGM